MKKIFLSTIVLISFAFSIILFEISCKKTAEAQSSPYVLPVATTSRLGGVIPDGTTISVDANGKISTLNSAVQQQNKILFEEFGTTDGATTIWTANSDGSNQQQINIVLPNGLGIGDNIALSQDHKTLVFDTYTIGADLPQFIYTCNVDGSNLKKIISSTSSTGDLNVIASY